MPIEQEDAITFMVQGLRDQNNNFAFQNHHVHIPHVVQAYLNSISDQQVEADEATRQLPDLGPGFYDAAWELCRRGILRVAEDTKQIRNAGEKGANNYDVTAQGRQWLSEADQYSLLCLQPGRLARVLANFTGRFGDGYLERSQEAIRCYSAFAYLGCCAMCGAAAESIVLKVAIEKDGDEERVLRAYLSTQGRRNIENLIVGQAPTHIKRPFLGYMDLINYWRDAATHGHRIGISEDEAFISLTQLYRFAIFVEQNWEDMIA